MAGHSKWANIQHRKGAQDAKRGKLFTRLIREITVAARLGGIDPNANPRLRAAIDKGYANNMKKDVVERAIQRGSGGLDGAQLEEVRYEGYGVGGVAVIVDCMTDNRNRTVAEVRHAFSKCGGNLGTDGCVAYLFKEAGVISFSSGNDENKLLEVALEAGADDVVINEDSSIDVITSPELFETVKAALQQQGHKAGEYGLTWQAATEVKLTLEQAEKMVRLLDMLEDLDDVQNVYSNANISDEVMSALGNK